MIKQIERQSLKKIIKGSYGLVIIGLILACTVSTLFFVKSLNHPYQLNYGEALLVNQAVGLSRGDNIYNTDLEKPPFTITNYPPLYILSMVPGIKLFGPVFWPGRLISMLSMLFSALIMIGLIYRLTNDKLAAISTGMLFFTVPIVTFWSSLARIDMLAFAFSMMALFLIATSKSLPWWRLGLGAVMLTAAIFTRQTFMLVAPATGFFWLLLHHRRQAFLLAGVVSMLVLASALLMNWITDGGFLFNVISVNIQTYELGHVLWFGKLFVKTMFVLIIIAAISLVHFFRKQEKIEWPFIYLIVAGLASLTVGKDGASENHLIELCAGFCMTTGVVIAYVRSQKDYRLIQLLSIVALCVHIGVTIQYTVTKYGKDLENRISQSEILEQFARLVRESPKPVLADEYMGMITMAGKPIQLHPFDFSQMSRVGKWDQTPLLKKIENQDYGLIAITYFSFWEGYKVRWTTEMLDKINTYYEPNEWYGITRVYRPKDFSNDD